MHAAVDEREAILDGGKPIHNSEQIMEWEKAITSELATEVWIG
jgi:hypothetical protein